MIFPDRPPRYATYIPIVVSHRHFRQSATIVDINTWGACISGITGLGPEDRIKLHSAVETNLATVRWQDEARAGVFFDSPVTPEYLAMLRLRGATQPSTQTEILRAS